MRCTRHAVCNQGRSKGCRFVQVGATGIEPDLIGTRYEQMAQHVVPGIRGIHTRGQYQRLLKSHRLTDDITTKELLACNRDTGKRIRIREQHFQSLHARIRDLACRTMH